MSGLIRTRLACDRCHSQKLRCPKQPGSSALCTRCLKAGASCVYSPPGTSISLFNNGNNSTEMKGSIMMIDGMSMNSGSYAEAFDWAACDVMDFNTLVPEPPPEEHRPSCHDDTAKSAPVMNGVANPPPPSDKPPRNPEETRSACTKRLADLLLDTDKLWARLLLISSTLHIPRNDPHEVYLKALTEKATTRYLLENLFTLAQQLIDLYSPVTDLVFSTDPDPACDVPDCTHEVDLPPVLRDLERQASPGPCRGTIPHHCYHADTALAGLLVSCHTRLLDVLDRVVLLVASCTRITLASPERREPDLEYDDDAEAAAEVRAGSFVPRRNAGVVVQMALLKHLMVCLSVKLDSLGGAAAAAVAAGAAGQFGGEAGRGQGHGQEQGQGEDEGLEVRVLALQHRALAGRHAKQIEHIGTIEGFLSTFDPNKI